MTDTHAHPAPHAVSHGDAHDGMRGGVIRTSECRFQRPVPYHLATPQ